MSKLCDNCHNLMEVNTLHGYLQFVCRACDTYKKATPEDSLRFAEDSKSSSQLSAVLLNKAQYDPANPLVKISCPKCKHQLARQIRTKKEMILINTCMKCSNHWI